MNRSRLLILIPLMIAACVRLAGIRHGEPDKVYHPDVAKQTRVAITLFSKGELNLRQLYRDDVRFTLYPYGTAIILARSSQVFAKLTGSKTFGQVHRWHWALRMRYVSVFFAIVSIAFVLWMLYERLGPLACLATGLLLALEPVSSVYSHYGMNDVPLVSLLVIAWASSGMMISARDRILPLFAVISGLAIGLGFGIKYQALLGGIAPLVALCLTLKTRSWKRASMIIIGTGLGAVVGAILTTPLLLHDPAYFFAKFPEFMKWQSNIMGEPIPMPEKISRNLPAFTGLAFTSARWLLLPGIIWGFACVLRRGKQDAVRFVYVLSAIIMCVLLTVAIITSRDIVRDTDLLPIHTFAILLFGLMVADARRNHRPGEPGCWKLPCMLILAGATCIVFAGTTARDSAALSRVDTRIQARDWCRARIPPGSRVLRERYTLPLKIPGVEEIDFRYLASARAQDLIRRGKFDYLITSSLAYGRFYDRASPFYDEQTQDRYQGLTDYCKPHVEFKDRTLPFAHPRITVYSRHDP